MIMNYSRQLDLFDPQTFRTPVHVIGAGATGSWLTLQLAKLGIQDITVWDFDIVEEHNIPNQFFQSAKYSAADHDWVDIGKKKATALQGNVSDFSGIIIKPKNECVDGTQQLRGIVFMLTDTMKSRKEIWERAIKYKPSVNLLIETRMGLDVGYVYTVNPLDPTQVKRYEETLYSDDVAQTSACGTSQSVVSTANMISSMAAWQLIKHHRHEALSNEILFDIRNLNLLHFKWGE